MALDPEVDLFAPVTVDTVLEVRTGKMTKFKGVNVESGIDKTICDGPVQVNTLGIVGDEHDPTFHGGVDKAIHGYCAEHYKSWSKEYPSAAERFVPGGFGENLVLPRMNERNVCIGDVVSVGPEVVLQVSLPRQPCFKLNHRFELRNFAPNTWKTSRTGWYYRVLEGGSIRAGDEVRLRRRAHPEWTIERIQEYLHRSPDRLDMIEELAAIEEFGAECKKQFAGRIARQRAKERRAARDRQEKWLDFRVVEKERQTPRITSFTLEAVEPDPEAEALEPGAHVKIRLANGLVRAYSVVDGDRNRFQLGVALADDDRDSGTKRSRGGSRYLHGPDVREGTVIQVGRFTSAVPAAAHASAHVFVAGGVGITAFLAVLRRLRRCNHAFALHYAVRSAGDVPFRARLDALAEGYAGGKVIIYDGSRGQRLDVGAVVRSLPWNAHVSFCGPRRMMDEGLAAAREAGLGADEVHFEAFEADAASGGDPFEAVVANRGGRVLRVGAEETLLEGLRRAFGDDDVVASSCEVGNCGTCRVAVRRGTVEHRGTALAEEDKGEAMLSCVSRGVGRIEIEI